MDGNPSICRSNKVPACTNIIGYGPILYCIFRICNISTNHLDIYLYLFSVHGCSIPSSGGSTFNQHRFILANDYESNSIQFVGLCFTVLLLFTFTSNNNFLLFVHSRFHPPVYLYLSHKA